MGNPYQKYKATSVTSASKEKLLLMMYEGAIKFTKLAKKACKENDIAARGYNIGRVYDIIMELNNTLDHSVSNDVSIQLEQLYMFITDELTKANLSGDEKHLDGIISILTTLYTGWKEAVEKIKKSNSNKLENSKGA